MKDLLVLKTTQSGFIGYHKDQYPIQNSLASSFSFPFLLVLLLVFNSTCGRYTTLQETTDRIFSTAVFCKWKFGRVDSSTNFNSAYENACSAIFGLSPFHLLSLYSSPLSNFLLTFSLSSLSPPPSTTDVFANTYSKSVQETQLITARQILDRVKEIGMKGAGKR